MVAYAGQVLFHSVSLVSWSVIVRSDVIFRSNVGSAIVSVGAAVTRKQECKIEIQKNDNAAKEIDISMYDTHKYKERGRDTDAAEMHLPSRQ